MCGKTAYVLRRVETGLLRPIAIQRAEIKHIVDGTKGCITDGFKPEFMGDPADYLSRETVHIGEKSILAESSNRKPVEKMHG